MPKNISKSTPVQVELSVVVLAVTDQRPKVLTVTHPGETNSLPYGPFDPTEHSALQQGLRSWVEEQTGLELGYIEQLYTFGNKFRDLREQQGGPRVITITYLALTVESPLPKNSSANWIDCYELFPWEDHRKEYPRALTKQILPALNKWAGIGTLTERRLRKERIDIAFASGTNWDGEKILERFELMYETGLSFEAERDKLNSSAKRKSLEVLRKDFDELVLGVPLVHDHRRIAASALQRIRGKLRYRPVVFELLPDRFTLLQLQQVVEALSGIKLHKQNFRRLVEMNGLVVGTGISETATGGRPAELFSFRHEVLRERQAPGVGLPRTPQ